ncbi:MAG: hypothetical protein JHD02_00135 [Thermoleophilaceae bacterium]|nr:hypothetical protein [Thermoleophilaceae bacterium]
MAKSLKTETFTKPKGSLLEDFNATSGIGAASSDEIVVRDTRASRGEAGGEESRRDEPPAAEAPRPQTSARPAKKQGAGRKKKLLIGARFKEEEMGPTFEVVQAKLTQKLGLQDGELSMQEIMSAVVRVAIRDDEQSLKWLVSCLVQERERSAAELMRAANRPSREVV